jgi:hypothetical protein
MRRVASCNCRQLRLACEGEPVRISMCHCLECQRRTGAVTSNQAWFPRERVDALEGEATRFVRHSDAGDEIAFRFCGVCGSTVWWETDARPGLIAVAVGTFADPEFPPPAHSVWERRQHRWLKPLLAGLPAEHSE